ncbi:MAG: fasciclin domain-containing protein [Phycisphaerae bacterium]
MGHCFLARAVTLFLAVTLATTTVAAQAHAPSASPEDAGRWPDLALAFESRPDASDFAAWIEAAGLAGVLTGPNAVTAFAPSNDAVAALDDRTRRLLLESQNRLALRKVVASHMAWGVAEARRPGVRLMGSLSGGSLRVTGPKPDAPPHVQNAPLAEAVPAANGVLFVIDVVLLPADLDLLPTPELLGEATTDDSNPNAADATAGGGGGSGGLSHAPACGVSRAARSDRVVAQREAVQPPTQASADVLMPVQPLAGGSAGPTAAPPPERRPTPTCGCGL